MKDWTAYNIKGQIYYRKGKPNAKTKKKLWQQIQEGQNLEKWQDVEKSSYTKERGVPLKTSKKEEIKGDLLKWLQI